MVALHQDGVVALGDDLVVPDGFRHATRTPCRVTRWRPGRPRRPAGSRCRGPRAQLRPGMSPGGRLIRNGHRGHPTDRRFGRNVISCARSVWIIRLTMSCGGRAAAVVRRGAARRARPAGQAHLQPVPPAVRAPARPASTSAAWTACSSVDPAARTADVQGMCTYEDLVDATLPHGLMPLVVPQLRTITLGGAVTGLGIESTSFRNGLPHESVLEMDVLTGAGEIVTARPDGEHADLFAAFPNSLGSLGYATRLRIELQPVRRYVALRNVRFTRLEDADRRDRRGDRQPGAWDGRAGRRDGRGDVQPRRGVPGARPRSPTTAGAAQRLHRPGRSTTGRCAGAPGTPSPRTTTCGAGTPTGSGARRRSACSTRWSAGSGRPGTGAATSTTGWSGWSTGYQVAARIDRLARPAGPGAGGAGRGDPAGRTGRLPALVRRHVRMTPVWLCPLRLREPAGPGSARAWPLYPLRPGRTYVNIGFWGTVPIATGAADGDVNRAIERAVSERGRAQVALLRRVLRPGDLRPALRRRRPSAR